jgi:hypothetical protein
MLGAFGLKSDDDVASGGPGTVGEPIDPPADGSYAIVLGTHRTESGFSLFGWHIGGSERRAHVAFVPPAGCVAPPSGPLAAEGACAGIPVEGDVSGGGTTSEGHDLVIVSVEVSEACQEALEHGARWPSSLAECRAES